MKSNYYYKRNNRMYRNNMYRNANDSFRISELSADRREAYIQNSLADRKELVILEKNILKIIFCLAVILSVFFITSKVSAGNFLNDKSTESVKMYKSIMVYSGDTFESIAAKFMSDEYSSENKYINEIYSINGMNEATKLIPGNRIIVPYYMSESINNCSLDPVIEISLAK